MESDAVQLTRMDYAMKSLSLLYPSSLARHVAVSTSVVTQQLVPKAGADAPRARPCRVSTADRSVRKGITACSLEDLLHKEVLRWALFGMRATGHVLLGTSCYVEQLLDATATEEAQPAKTRASSLLPACLKLLP
uniref:CIDE-N domain-containing protein n=1 Tax=Chinchilla lanigera TaxID=34839 RepID=A0A8C2UR08_CHILA